MSSLAQCIGLVVSAAVLCVIPVYALLKALRPALDSSGETGGREIVTLRFFTSWSFVKWNIGHAPPVFAAVLLLTAIAIAQTPDRPRVLEEELSELAKKIRKERGLADPDAEEKSVSTTERARGCLQRYGAFVQALDALLARHPSSVTVVHDLINSSFPIKGCNIEEAVEISRRARFFSSVSEDPRYYVIEFNSRGLSGILDPGYRVLIGFSKGTGNSLLPSANINP
jgi:hypothetical protein